jgi:hypothetical protein
MDEKVCLQQFQDWKQIIVSSEKSSVCSGFNSLFDSIALAVTLDIVDCLVVDAIDTLDVIYRCLMYSIVYRSQHISL